MKHNEQKKMDLEHSKNEKSSIVHKLGVASRHIRWERNQEKQLGDELIQGLGLSYRI